MDELDATALGRLDVHRHDGHEPFHAGHRMLPFTLLDFWQWSSSDVVGNTMRGILAEYIVGQALNAQGIRDGVREEWATFDLTDTNGVPVEVKSAAYIQTWAQKTLSAISFKYPKTYDYDPDTGEQSATKTRHAQVYVFALLKNQDQASIDPLDMDQWEFYVVPTKTLDERQRSQDSITLRSLQAICKPVGFFQVRSSVDCASASSHGG